MDLNNYPAGGSHVFPLLDLLLPGLDMNDMSKTIAAYSSVLAGFFSGLVLKDVSEQASDEPVAATSQDVTDCESDMVIRMNSTAKSEAWLEAFLMATFQVVSLFSVPPKGLDTPLSLDRVSR